MTENDKILINAYLDGETSEDESKYIESLLKSNNEANNYANELKRANHDINTFFDSSEIKELELDISNFIEKVKSKKRKYFFDNLMSLFKSRYLVGSFVATSIIYFVFIPTYINQDSDKLFTDNLSEFSTDIDYIDIYKYRGNSDINESVDSLLISSIDHMLKDKLKNTIMVYGTNSYFIKIESIIINNRDIYCLNGYYKLNGEDTKFKFCKTLDETTISFN